MRTAVREAFARELSLKERRQRVGLRGDGEEACSVQRDCAQRSGGQRVPGMEDSSRRVVVAAGAERWRLRGHGGSDLKSSSGWTEGATFQRGRADGMCPWVAVKPSMAPRFLAWAAGRLSCRLPKRLGAAVLREEVGLLLATSVRQVQVSVRPLVIHVYSLRKKPEPEVRTWALSTTQGIQSHEGVRSPRVT